LAGVDFTEKGLKRNWIAALNDWDLNENWDGLEGGGVGNTGSGRAAVWPENHI
jgi:hypothetical protein